MAERDPELTELVERMDAIIAEACKCSRIELAERVRLWWEKARPKLKREA